MADGPEDLPAFVAGCETGVRVGLRNAARFLFKAAREAPMPSDEDDARTMLRAFAKHLNRGAKI